MTITQALRDSSAIVALGPQEQFYGRLPYMALESLMFAADSIGAVFVEFWTLDDRRYMFDLKGSLIYVW
jgi:hypothetical protein